MLAKAEIHALHTSAPAVFDLVALEVGLVLENANERHSFCAKNIRFDLK